MNALKGGENILVVLDDGNDTKIEVLVRQLPLRDYDKAFLAVDDEFKLAAIICEKPEDFVKSLTPESYELLRETVERVNEKGFFVFSARKQKALSDKMASVSPSVLKAVMDKVLSPSNASPVVSRRSPV